MNPFLIRSLILAIALSALIALLPMYSELELPIHLHFWNLGYFLFTIVSHGMLISSSNKKGAPFITTYMGVTTLKLLMTMAALGVFLYLNEVHRAEVAITVFVLYISYTFLEVAYLQKVLRK